MTGPSSSPRGEKPGKPGVRWESWVQWQAETWEPDTDTTTPSPPLSETALPDANPQQPPPIPNRKTRRAIARRRKS